MVISTSPPDYLVKWIEDDREILEKMANEHKNIL